MRNTFLLKNRIKKVNLSHEVQNENSNLDFVLFWILIF